MVRYYQQIEFTEKFNLKSNARRDSNECCIKLTKISAKVEEKVLFILVNANTKVNLKEITNKSNTRRDSNECCIKPTKMNVEVEKKVSLLLKDAKWLINRVKMDRY